MTDDRDVTPRGGLFGGDLGQMTAMTLIRTLATGLAGRLLTLPAHVVERVSDDNDSVWEPFLVD